MSNIKPYAFIKGDGIHLDSDEKTPRGAAEYCRDNHCDSVLFQSWEEHDMVMDNENNIRCTFTVKEDPQHHFYASSVGEWRTNVDMLELIKIMQTGRMRFSLWSVPVEETSNYKIEHFAPQVEGAVFLGYFDVKG